MSEMHPKRPCWSAFGLPGGQRPNSELGQWFLKAGRDLGQWFLKGTRDHFKASGRPGAGNVSEKPQKRPFWTTFKLRGGLGPRPKSTKNDRFGPLLDRCFCFFSIVAVVIISIVAIAVIAICFFQGEPPNRTD